jgi:hypothetical protein
MRVLLLGMKEKQYTELVFVMDRSGSMSGMEEHAVESFNRFLNEQKKVSGEAGLTLALFDNQIEKPIETDDINKVNEISASDFVPRATTALLDAIGTSIKETRKKLRNLPEDKGSGKAIFAIFTDGYENASSKYNWEDIARKISRRTEKDGWEFLFLAANEDAIATACSLNIKRKNASRVKASKQAMETWGKSVSSKVRTIRQKMMDEDYDKACYSKSLDDIVREDLAEEEN